MSAPASAANVNITLPDGKVLTFARGVVGQRDRGIYRSGASPKAALILEVDGKQGGPVPADRSGRQNPDHHQERPRKRWNSSATTRRMYSPWRYKSFFSRHTGDYRARN
ncbi:MAG: hypothetical protein WDM89_19145 [Rhizomicrobium sp.]